MSNAVKKVYPKFLFKIEDVVYADRFNTRQFGPYEHPKTGKLIYLLNPDGREIESGLIVSQLNILYNVEKVADSEIVKFLLNHPSNKANGGFEFSLIDVAKEAENDNEDLINELTLQAKIMTLGVRELKATASALGLLYETSKIGLQTSIVRRVRTPQLNHGVTTPGYVSVKQIIEAKKTPILLDINRMLKYKLIKINNSGVYFHGNHNLGLNPDQVVVYFDNNQDVYGLLKTELRRELSAEGKLDQDDSLKLDFKA